MNTSQLRISQYETVLFNANLNPKGIPNTVRNAIKENIDTIVKYPDIYYTKLKTAVSSYVDAPLDSIIMGNGSTDLLKLFATLIHPKKTMLISPGPNEFANVLYPTSKKISHADMKSLVEVCEAKDIFLIIDEMYIEFIDNHLDFTAVPLTNEYSNIAVIRSVSKFFAVPGLRFAYAVMNNPEYKEIIDRITTKNNIASLTAIAITEMFKDQEYIEDSQSIIHTERSLVYLAMSTSKTIKLIKPDANFMLVKLLKDDITASDVAVHCNQRGIIIRKCDDIRGLNNKYIRICFMNPKQNDLMVNTILEIV